MSFAHTEDGTRIQYETHGSGRMKVILLHGWGGSSSYWRELVSHLNLEGLQIIAPSYRGHGDSGQPAMGYTLDQFAKDMLSVADDAGAERFVLVGFSMSGKFAHDSGEYRSVRGKLQRNRERITVRGLNDNHNKDLKNLFKSAAISASTRPGPLQDFYVALVAKGIRPTMARLTLARKIAAITLTMWKKGVSFDPKQLHRQAA